MNAAVFNFFILLTVGILVRYKFNPDGAIWGYGIMAVSLTGIVLQSTILKGLEENKESLGLVQSLGVLTKSIIGSQFPFIPSSYQYYVVIHNLQQTQGNDFTR